MPATPRPLERNAVPNRTLVALYLGLAMLTWSVFAPTLGHPFIRYDDQSYVYENPEITAGLSVGGGVGAFTHLHARNWHPLTTISHMLDCQLFGLNPAGHHLTNVLLHTVAVLLLFGALRGMTGALWRSAFVAAVFAIHPLRVESVAWVAERKDVLSAVFFMLTLSAYVRYVRQPALARYCWIMFFFALGLMSKPMLVTLPFLLLLLDYWPLARLAHEPAVPPNEARNRFSLSTHPFLEKLPLLFLSLMAAVATLIAQRSTVRYSEPLPLTWRIGNAFEGYLAYIGQMLWPARLALFYPHTADRLPLWHVALTLLLLAGITCIAVILRRTHPYLVAGWGWYLIGLLPVIGLVQVGLQGRADRYTYLPQIGLYLALTWAVADLPIFTRSRRAILSCLAATIIALLSWQASVQTSYWSNTESLWPHALAVTDKNDIAHYNVAAFLMNRGQLDEAIWHYEQALKLQSDTREGPYHLSVALLHNSLGNALAQKGRLDEAITHYGKAVELNGNFADAHINLGAMLARKGQTAEAIRHYEKAVAIPPEDSISHVALAELLQKTRDARAAIAHYRRALEIAPDSVAVLNSLAWELATNPEPAIRNGAEAVALAEKGTHLTDGKNPRLLRTLAASYAAAGRYAEAVATAQRTLRMVKDPVVACALEQEIKLYQQSKPAVSQARTDPVGP